MLWCKATFEREFAPDRCRLFPTQQQLFSFLDEGCTAASTIPSQHSVFPVHVMHALDADMSLRDGSFGSSHFDSTIAIPTPSRTMPHVCTTDREPWYSFAIEFPSECEVSAQLSHHGGKQDGTLFRRAAPEACIPVSPRTPNECPSLCPSSSCSTSAFLPLSHNHKRTRCRTPPPVRTDFCVLYGETTLSRQTRMFLAVTRSGLIDMLHRIEPAQLHLYEIIRSGAACHLYLDVEREADFVALHHEIDVDVDNSSESHCDVNKVEDGIGVKDEPEGAREGEVCRGSESVVLCDDADADDNNFSDVCVGHCTHRRTDSSSGAYRTASFGIHAAPTMTGSSSSRSSRRRRRDTTPESMAATDTAVGVACMTQPIISCPLSWAVAAQWPLSVPNSSTRLFRMPAGQYARHLRRCCRLRGLSHEWPATAPYTSARLGVCGLHCPVRADNTHTSSVLRRELVRYLSHMHPALCAAAAADDNPASASASSSAVVARMRCRDSHDRFEPRDVSVSDCEAEHAHPDDDDGDNHHHHHHHHHRRASDTDSVSQCDEDENTDEPLSSPFREMIVLQSVPLSAPSPSLRGAESVTRKFSQHYIGKLGNHGALGDGAVAGEVVRGFVDYLAQRAAARAAVHAALFYHDPPILLTHALRHRGATTCQDGDVPVLPLRCVIDLAVYSRNRSMRCLGSCKLHKSSVLVLSERHLRRAGGPRAVVPHVAAPCPPPPAGRRAGVRDFFDTLIAATPEAGVLCGGATAASGRAMWYYDGGSVSHVSPLKSRQRTHLWAPSRRGEMPDRGHAEGCGAVVSDEAAALQQRIADELSAAYRSISGESRCSVAVPPRVMCDGLDERESRRSGRYWLYDVRHTRFCQNVSREHRSNRVYLVVDVQRGTWTQKCFDPNCAHYRAAAQPLRSLERTGGAAVSHGDGGTIT